MRTSTPSWRRVEARLRPFVRSRVSTEADADDVLQEVLMRMHRGLASLSDQEKLDAWMYAIARTSLVDHRRGRARHPLPAQGDAFEAPVEQPPADDDDAAMRDLVRVVGIFVAMLPSPYRETLVLTELEGRSHREAAEMLGVGVGAVKSRVHRGRKMLRAALEDCCRIELDARGRVIECAPRGGAGMPEGCCC